MCLRKPYIYLQQSHVTVLRSTSPVNVQMMFTPCTSAEQRVLQKSTVIWPLLEADGRFVNYYFWEASRWNLSHRDAARAYAWNRSDDVTPATIFGSGWSQCSTLCDVSAYTVVRAMCQVNGRWLFSATWGSETPEPIHLKSDVCD